MSGLPFIFTGLAVAASSALQGNTPNNTIPNDKENNLKTAMEIPPKKRYTATSYIIGISRKNFSKK